MTALLCHLPGQSCKFTPDKYKQIWRFTTDHLRKTKGLHNIITCYSPDHFKGRDEYLERYPTDREVNGLDVGALVKHWGTDNLLYDIGPTPLCDGIVDAKNLIVLAEHIADTGTIIVRDINCNSLVDFSDFAELAQNWLLHKP